MIEEKLLQRINLRLNKAEHILTQTYPLLKDPRILLGVLENINLAINDFITYKLDKEYRTLDEEKKYNIFKNKFNEDIELIKEIKELWQRKKNSPVDFVKNDKLHLCSDEFDMRIISGKDMEKLLNKVKLLIKKE